GDVVVLPIDAGPLRDRARRLGLPPSLVRRAETADFRGRADDVFVHGVDGRNVVLVGMGGESGMEPWRKLGARARREAERQGARRVAAYLGDAVERPEALAAVAEGFLLAGYRFDRYKVERKASKVEVLVLGGERAPKPAIWKPALDGVASLTSLVCSARD